MSFRSGNITRDFSVDLLPYGSIDIDVAGEMNQNDDAYDGSIEQEHAEAQRSGEVFEGGYRGDGL